MLARLSSFSPAAGVIPQLSALLVLLCISLFRLLSLSLPKCRHSASWALSIFGAGSFIMAGFPVHIECWVASLASAHLMLVVLPPPSCDKYHPVLVRITLSWEPLAYNSWLLKLCSASFHLLNGKKSPSWYRTLWVSCKLPDLRQWDLYFSMLSELVWYLCLSFTVLGEEEYFEYIQKFLFFFTSTWHYPVELFFSWN